MSRSVAMSKQRPSKAQGDALIALSGGAGSTALLDIMTHSDYAYVGRRDAGDREKVRGAKVPVWERGTVVYVEFCGVVDGLQDRTEEMRRLAEERGLDFLGLKAEDVFDASLEQRLGRTAHTPSQLFADLSHPGEPIFVVENMTLTLQIFLSLLLHQLRLLSIRSGTCSHRFRPHLDRPCYREFSITSSPWPPTPCPVSLIYFSAKRRRVKPSGSYLAQHSVGDGLYPSSWAQRTSYPQSTSCNHKRLNSNL